VRFRIAAIAFRPIALPTVDSRMLDMNRLLPSGPRGEGCEKLREAAETARDF
jgi:hypothetical protein